MLESEKLDYSMSSDLMIQDEAVNMVINMLNLSLESPVKRILSIGKSTSTLANELYLRGKGSHRNYETDEDPDVPIELYKKAIKEDSLFADAYAALGEALWSKYRVTTDSKDADEAILNIKHALRLNDQNVVALIMLSTVLINQDDFEEAIRYLNPASAFPVACCGVSEHNKKSI